MKRAQLIALPRSVVDQERVSLVSNEVAEISTRKRDLEGETKKAYDLKMRLLKEEEALRVQLVNFPHPVKPSLRADISQINSDRYQGKDSLLAKRSQEVEESCSRFR